MQITPSINEVDVAIGLSALVCELGFNSVRGHIGSYFNYGEKKGDPVKCCRVAPLRFP